MGDCFFWGGRFFLPRKINFDGVLSWPNYNRGYQRGRDHFLFCEEVLIEEDEQIQLHSSIVEDRVSGL